MSGSYGDLLRGYQPLSGTPTTVRACNCVGPQHGDPVCPCRMPEHNRRKRADKVYEWFAGTGWPKPRFRVKAGRRVVP